MTAKGRLRSLLPPLVMLAIGLAIGWFWRPNPAPPVIQISAVDVEPLEVQDETILRIVTSYQNRDCSQTLLARFLLNTRPTPSIALPQQQGPTILPQGQSEMIEEVHLGFLLGQGQWHLFSVASCYMNGDPVPAATVSPTALFSVK